VQVAAAVDVVGSRRVVAVEHIVGGGAGAGFHQLVAATAHIPYIEVGPGVLAVALPLNVDVQYL
jgi:hypothetical protein